jgi:hypothetical protein
VCGRKSILEVEFLEEEGTGLGPTLEFFALVAAEFQRSGILSCESGSALIWLPGSVSRSMEIDQNLQTKLVSCLSKRLLYLRSRVADPH